MRLCEPCVSHLNLGLAPDEIIKKGCEFSQIPYSLLESKVRRREIVEPRQMIMTLLCDNTTLTLKGIGAKFGGRDHTTVIHARETIRGLVRYDDAVKSRFNLMKEYVFNN